MKGKKLLSLITAGAIATTVGVSFAAWDQLSDTATVSIDVAKQVVVSINSTALNFTNKTLATSDSVLGGDTQEADFSVNITNNTNAVDKLTFEATEVKAGDVDVAGVVKVAVYEGANDITTTGDTDLSSTAYKVKVSIKENPTDEEIAKVAGKTVNFTLKATAEKATQST